MRILIAGAAGFIGSNMVSFLKRNEPDARLDLFDLQYGCDLLDRESCEEACWGKDLVIHFANLSHVEKSIPPSASEQFLRNNIFGTWNLLNACRDQRCKMIYISSSEVYGSAQSEFLNEKGQMPETHPLFPHSPYAASKVECDRGCHAHWKTYGTDVRIVRPFNQFGPSQASEKLVPKIIDYQLRGHSFPCEDGGEQSRDYLYVQDTVRGIWTARDLPAGEAVNLCYGKDYSVRWFAERIQDILGVMGKLPLPSAAPWISSGSRPGQVSRLCGCPDKAKAMLGWEPQNDLEVALESVVHWYVGHGFVVPPDEGNLNFERKARSW